MGKAIVAIGLPESGKTTFLAALWHLLTNKKVLARLSLEKLTAEEATYLRAIATRWAQAKKQERTFHSGNKTVKLSLKSDRGAVFDLTFPDIAGEAFSQMWEMRECATSVADALRATGVLLFIHVDKIKPPGWIADDTALAESLGHADANAHADAVADAPTKALANSPDEGQADEIVQWKPESSPTQVQLVDMLRCLQMQPFDIGPRKLAVVLSAWDKVENDDVSPELFLELHLPLLHQYLTHGLSDGWTHRTFGVSAQGAEYDDSNGAPSPEADRMRDMEVPSQRIKVVVEGSTSHDLTEPVNWLLE
ncbi:TRAFAC clade GTPase domain-containing protein [Hydrogenophaga electricum]|jgi:hypothetical protein|uniref:Double-GTPase 1 domain-containing protein n=1 Tax=Hydrogenophaga electricum TaxID=1230953 RepID=A0ABQ6BZ35_9BURK|nr:hypothetical protein [Hydrogenophaga electricum]GLS13428.1 hypothetical protein GCM10007935_08570 [Hydrogenophaga electricum]